MHWKIKATEPLKPKNSHAVKAGLLLAALFLLFALMHLIRIDKLMEVIAQTLGQTGAKWFIALIAIGEVFALPYLLRLRLSPGFRIVSGCFVILVPLAWTSFTIWAAGNGRSTGQFSSYVATPSVWWLIVLNLVWLGACYWLLWASDFNAAFRRLSKKP